MKTINRRAFGKQMAVLSATAALSSTRILGANERVRLRFIGVGNRGDQLMDAFLKQPDSDIAAPPQLSLAISHSKRALCSSGTQPRNGSPTTPLQIDI
ncbi:MAG: hypothetical protein ACP5MD_11130 [Verrucomicrobiia bacterium]